MKKILLSLFFIFSIGTTISNAEIKPIIEGNTFAKVKLIVFESLTCSHCANFHKDVYPQLKEEYLDTGLAKIEFRHFPLDVAAFNASKVSQCKNDGDSAILNSLYANQQKWVKGSSVKEANENLQKFCNLAESCLLFVNNLKKVTVSIIDEKGNFSTLKSVASIINNDMNLSKRDVVPDGNAVADPLD